MGIAAPQRSGDDHQDAERAVLEQRLVIDGPGEPPVASGAERVKARDAARRHTRRVRRLRFVVPGIGGLLVLAIVAMMAVSSYLDGLGFGAITLTTDGLVMDSPELSGHDGDRSYRVSASRAIQRISDPRIIDLERIRAELTLSADQHLSVNAVRGIYNSTEETLALSDGVDVRTSEGYTARFGSLFINMKSGEIDTPEATTLTSSFGELTASRMRFDRDGSILTFTDGIRMTIDPSKAEQSP
uniref:LPS export ABC transporter periplasmic protein LptC n=1 Tax=Stappia sp. TaxID=1870903 RepID=UPI003BAD9E2F